jgi:enamine deaminase RidA (YjgF/YER057c/UK114 family)
VVTGARQRWSDGAWEEPFGYSRVVRVGPHVHVAGTTAPPAEGRELPGDAAEQARAVLARIAGALAHVGAGVGDVVRTRVYVVEGVDPHVVMAEHAEVFRDVRPAAALVVVRALLTPGMLVEIEADAYVT